MSKEEAKKSKSVYGADDLEKAEQELRERTKKLCKQVDTAYWELGQALYEVYDGIPGGYRELLKGEGSKEARIALFKKWGYSSFEEYCEREVGLQRRSASNIRYAYYWFKIELDLPAEIIEQLKALGRSKVYLLAGFVQKDNVMSWIEKAQEMTHDELKKVIVAARASKKGNTKTDDEMFERSKTGGEINDDGYTVAPAPETQHTLHTSLYDGQWNTWNAALERAKGVTGSDTISHNLEMICMDYLATNDFADPAEDQKRTIAKYERLLGLKLIAIDPKTGKPVYGADLLWAMVKSRVQFEEEEQKKQVESNPAPAADRPPLKLVKGDGEDPTPSF